MTDIAPSNPISALDPDSVTLLFDTDPNLLAPVDLDKLIEELRARARTNAAELAAKEAEPKTKAKRTKAELTSDPVTQALRDKPVSELSLGDLLGDGGMSQ